MPGGGAARLLLGVPMDCAVCGRMGSVVLCDGPPRVEHHWGYCDLPPRVKPPKVKGSGERYPSPYRFHRQVA